MRLAKVMADDFKFTPDGDHYGKGEDPAPFSDAAACLKVGKTTLSESLSRKTWITVIQNINEILALAPGAANRPYRGLKTSSTESFTLRHKLFKVIGLLLAFTWDPLALMPCFDLRRKRTPLP